MEISGKLIVPNSVSVNEPWFWLMLVQVGFAVFVCVGGWEGESAVFIWQPSKSHPHHHHHHHNHQSHTQAAPCELSMLRIVLDTHAAL